MAIIERNNASSLRRQKKKMSINLCPMGHSILNALRKTLRACQFHQSLNSQS